MTELRPAQKRKKGKKITGEVLRSNPWLAQLIRLRIKELRAMRQARREGELPFPENEG